MCVRPIPTGCWLPPAVRTDPVPASTGLRAGPAGRRRAAGFHPLARRLLLVLILAAAACAPVPPEKKAPRPADVALDLRPARFDDLPGWADGRQSEALPVFLASCRRLSGRLGGEHLGGDVRFGRLVDWRLICAEAARLTPGDDPRTRAFLVRHFAPFVALGRDREGTTHDDGLFTGYYEAVIRADRRPSARYPVPVLGPPDALVTVDLGAFRDDLKGRRIAGRLDGGRLVPHATRAEIAAGALDGRNLAFLWADDPVDLFFLHVQGSGRALLADGTTVRVGYAATNGHPYRSIGRVLIDRGEISGDAMSMQALRGWIAAHPVDGLELLNENPSYVFLAERAGPGPVGAQGVALTPGRSLAVDDAFLPYGVPLWLDVRHPRPGAAPLRRLVMAQDTGGAIRGAVRGDLFWGHGPEAERMAGTMKETGRYWLLLPRRPGP